MIATLTELEERLEWELDEGEKRIAAAALEDLEADALYYGRPEWEFNAPNAVKRLVLRAAARFMRNPDGFDTSRAGDETVVFGKAMQAGTAQFDDREIGILQNLANPVATGGLFSVGLTAHGNTPVRGTVYVPSYNDANGGYTSPFPLFDSHDPVFVGSDG